MEKNSPLLEKPKIPPFIGPLVLLCFYIGVMVLIRGKFPDIHTFVESVRILYATYGYPLIFFGAFFEGMFLVSMYVPGSAIILMGAALSREGVVSFPLVFLLGTTALILAYTVNYFLGRHGWYRIIHTLGLGKGFDHAKESLTKHHNKAILLGYMVPSTASFLSTAAGVLRVPFKRFLLLSIIAQVMWSLLWGTLAYFLGMTFVEILIQYFAVVIIIGAAIVVVRNKFFVKKP